MKDCILILSGGMDSTTLLYDYQDRIALAISFDYGSNHNAKEIPFAKMHCERLGIKHLVIPLDFMSQYFRSSLLSGDQAIPEGHYADENMKSTVVGREQRPALCDDGQSRRRSHHLSRLPPRVCRGFRCSHPCRHLQRCPSALTLLQHDKGPNSSPRQGTGHQLRRDLVVLSWWRQALWPMRHLRRAPGSPRRSRHPRSYGL